MEKRFAAAAAALLLTAAFAGCGAEGKTPVVDDVAQALPEAGLVEAWGGEPDGAGTERMDIYDENNALCGYSTASYDEYGRLLREECYDLADNLISTWEYHYEGDEREYTRRSDRMDIYDENGVPCGYFVGEYDGRDRLLLEEEFDLDGNSTSRLEHSYSEDGRERVTTVYVDGVFNSKMLFLNDEQGETIEQRTYDDRDTLLSVDRYDGNGGLALTELYMGEAGAERKYAELTYGENGSVEERVYAPDGSLESVWRREYDEFFREIRSLCYEGGSFRWDHRYAYDERDLCIRWETYGENNVLLEYETMEYTPEGLLSVKEVYSAADVLTEHMVWEYAADGRVLSMYRYDGSGQVKEYTLTDYDEQDRIKREETFDPDEKSLGHTYYKYAEDGSCEAFTYYGDNRLASRTRYDAEGNLLERIDED